MSFMAIRVIDLETTGIDSTDHVVEIGSVDLLPDGSIGRFQEYLIKPPCPIPAEARAVHRAANATRFEQFPRSKKVLQTVSHGLAWATSSSEIEDVC